MRKSLISWAGASLAALPLASFFTVVALTGSTALADQKVGVAAAVKPEATSQPPGGDASTLRIGKSVVYNEHIDTSGSGQVQVLLLDGSTFTVGPGSSLVIDKFVYNPSSGKGALVASFSKGALRFVGGKLSKNAPGVTVNTPAGALTVRGGIALIKVSGPNQLAAACIFGDFLALKRGQFFGKVRPDTMFVVFGPGPVVTRATTPADISSLLAAVSGQKFKFAGKAGKKKGWPYYYGIQPTGYPDQPFIKEWYYDGATTGILLNGLTRVPTPQPPQNYPTYPYDNLSVGPNGPR